MQVHGAAQRCKERFSKKVRGQLTERGELCPRTCSFDLPARSQLLAAGSETPALGAATRPAVVPYLCSNASSPAAAQRGCQRAGAWLVRRRRQRCVVIYMQRQAAPLFTQAAL